MNRKEAMRLTHQENTLISLGFTIEQADALRRISMTLRRWYEKECNGEVERDEKTDKTYAAREGRRLYPIADKERGAEKRLKAIIDAHNNVVGSVKLAYYLQTDPRGASLYIIRPGDVREGRDVSSYYTNGLCIY